MAELEPESPDYQAQAREVWEPVAHPEMAGWRVNRQTKPQTYRSPAGEVMNISAYGAHRKRVRQQQEAKPEEVRPLGVPDLIEPTVDKPALETKRAGLATPQELAETSWLLLLMATFLLGWVLKIPELAMTQEEAWGFAAPIGNILERSPVNKQYGKYLKDGSDWVKLGYTLWAYLIRVNQQVNYRRQAQAYAAQPAPAMAAPTPGPAPAPAPTNGARPEPARAAMPDPARSLPFGPTGGRPQTH